ncbi:hypothetical protein ANCCEY_13290 [Ancylostoma ceylanicum]|uniref:Solute carrier family 35 member F1 n=1 Tax=Ancylostoma ceylanicum TaxID=53326 RepID=A0A0D6LCP2_9BILA|nr:hypothetical protein ANCCEY_13290 [Ancylostoma ceylanicum]
MSVYQSIEIVVVLDNRDPTPISRTFRSIALGQVLSLCLCGTGISSQLLSNRGVNAPAAQSFTNYFLLCFVYCTALSCKAGEQGLLGVLRRRGLQYFLLALIDVEANYMIVYAYQFTNLTSVQLLDCSTIPMVLLLSWLFLSVRYLISHIIGVCICLIGIACLIWADILDEKGSIGGNHRVVGDLLCLGGAMLYAVANVSEEFLVKQHSRMEYLGMVGLFGSLISGVQLAVLEHKNLAQLDWSAATIGCFILFAVSMFIFYSLVTVVLQKTSALMFNLSTLTADFYSLLFGLFLFKDTFHYLYFVSFLVVVTGSVIYSIRETQVSSSFSSVALQKANADNSSLLKRAGPKKKPDHCRGEIRMSRVVCVRVCSFAVVAAIAVSRRSRALKDRLM